MTSSSGRRPGKGLGRPQLLRKLPQETSTLSSLVKSQRNPVAEGTALLGSPVYCLSGAQECEGL